VPVTVVCTWSGTVDCVEHCAGLCGTLWTMPDKMDCAGHWTVRDSVDCAGHRRLCETLWTVRDTVDCAGHYGLYREL
jgi:hypothetical protein